MQDLWIGLKSLVSADFRLSAVIFYEKAPTACKGLGNNDN
jgi:hypothetical protein